MPAAIREINIKRDRPIADVARERLINEIARAQRDGVQVLKIIHGYGSSGKGGVLREELREQLDVMLKSRTVKNVILGENFGMFDRATADLTGKLPELLKDADYNRANRGITIIAL